jgi:hypothetical protein
LSHDRQGVVVMNAGRSRSMAVFRLHVSVACRPKLSPTGSARCWYRYSCCAGLPRLPLAGFRRIASGAKERRAPFPRCRAGLSCLPQNGTSSSVTPMPPESSSGGPPPAGAPPRLEGPPRLGAWLLPSNPPLAPSPRPPSRITSSATTSVV